MSTLIGVLIIALVLGVVLGTFIRGEFFNRKTYATVIGISIFIDVMLGSFPFYTWDVGMELPVSGVFFSIIVGLFIGKAIGGK
jgi:hypothetical protein